MLLPVNTLPSPAPLDDTQEQPTPNVGYVEELTKILEMTSEEDRETILQNVTQNFDATNFGLKQMTAENIGTVEDFVKFTIDQGQLTPDQFRIMLDDVARKQETVEKSPTVTLETFLLSQNGDMTPAELRATSNLSMAEARLTAEIEQAKENTNWAEWAIFGADSILRALTIGTAEDMTRRTERLSGELLTAAVTMEPDEFSAYFDNYMAGLKEEGIFLGNHTAALERGLQEVVSYGYDPNADITQALAVVDALTTVTPLTFIKGAKGAAKAVGSVATRSGREALVAARKANGLFHKITAAKGADEALDAAKKAIKKGDERAVTQSSPQILDPEIPPVRMPAQASRILAENQLAKQADELINSGVAGRTLTKEQLTTQVEKIVNRFTKRVDFPVVGTRIVRDFAQDFRVAVQLGKKSDGKPYSTLASATKAAKGDPELTVVPVNQQAYDAAVKPKDYKDGFVLEYQERISTAGVSNDLTFQSSLGPIRKAMSRLLGSSSTLDDVINSTLAYQGESATSSLVNLAKPLVQKLNALSVDARDTLDRVMSELRDGPDAGLRYHYTDAEFKRKYREHNPRGLEPTEKELEAYRAAITIEDAAYLFQASRILNVYVDNGFKAISFNGRRYVAREVSSSSIPETAAILDPKGFAVAKDKIGNQQVWQLNETIDGDIAYVVKPESVTTLTYDDVLGYNPGGRRVYTKANYIVVTGTKKDGWAGKIAAKTEKEAKRAVAQLETLRKAVLEAGGADKLDESFEALIAKNNDWNTDIDSVESFLKWADDYKIDFNREFSWKSNRGLVEAGEAGGVATPDGLTWGQRVAMQMSRSDTTLMQYGGGQAYTLDPLVSIGRQYTRGAHLLANQAAVRNSIDKWVNYVKDNPNSGWEINPADAVTGDYYRMFRGARPVGGATSTQSQLDHMRNVYLTRFNMGEPGSFARAYEAATKELGEFILDSRMGRYAPGEWLGDKVLNGRPAEALLRIGFGVTFGFFNFRQLIVQSVHGMITAPVIAGNAAAGKAAMLHLPFRAAMAFRGTRAGDLIVTRMTKFSGIPEKDIRDFMDYATRSGRMVVSGESVEQGTGAALDVAQKGMVEAPSVLREGSKKLSRLGKRAYDTSLLYYRGGEQTTRFSTMLIAFFEYKKKFPKGDIFSDEALRWMTKRDQDLSFHMTNAGRAMVQQGIGRVPTQWLSYPMRAMEAIFIGRGFTPAERVRAALVLGPMYGMTGIGLVSAADDLAEFFGVEPGEEVYTGIKYGLIDYLLAEAGVDISVSGSLSPISAVKDIITTIKEESPVSIALGPSGEIVGGTVGAMWGAVTSLMNGTPAITTEKVGRVLRTITSLDNAAKALGMLEFGTLRTKNYGITEGNFDAIDAAAQFLGFSPMEVTELAMRREQKFKADEKVKAFRSELNGMADKAFEFIGSTDPDRRDQGIRLLEDLSVAIEVSPFGEDVKDSLRRSLMTERTNTVLELTKFLLNQEQDAYAAQALQNVFER